MHSARKVFATSMIAAAGAVAAALMLSATASAEPIPAPPAPAPAMPNMPFLNQLAGLPAAAPQLIQGLASAFTGGGAAPTLPRPVTPAPHRHRVGQAAAGRRRAAAALPAAAAAAAAPMAGAAGPDRPPRSGLADARAGTPLARLPGDLPR